MVVSIELSLLSRFVEQSLGDILALPGIQRCVVQLVLVIILYLDEMLSRMVQVGNYGTIVVRLLRVLPPPSNTRSNGMLVLKLLITCSRLVVCKGQLRGFCNERTQRRPT